MRWRQRLLRLLPWHRRLALLACLGVFTWAASGMLHPLMSALQPRPAQFVAPRPALPLEQLRAPAQVLATAGVPAVAGLRLLVLDGQPYYQARLPGQSEPRYWHARTGAPADLAARHAESLAAHYLGEDAGLRYRGSLTGFSSEYAFINRLLPAARVDTAREDGLRLYVDLYQDRLGTLVDDRKAWFSLLFQQLHSFAWLQHAGTWRVVLMLVLLASVALTALLGLALFIARRRAPTRLRRLHGWGGMLLALVSLSFLASGTWHLLHKRAAPAPLVDYAAQLSTAKLVGAPAPEWLPPGDSLYRLHLVELDGEPTWRLEADHALFYRTAGGEPLPGAAAQRYLQQRFAYYAAQRGLGQPREIQLQERFDHEYGFIFKRLPVLKASYDDADNSALFLDPVDGALAARVSNADRLEGAIFAYLHKWELLNHLGKVTKDLLLSLSALSLLLLACTGLWLHARRPQRTASTTLNAPQGETP